MTSVSELNLGDLFNAPVGARGRRTKPLHVVKKRNLTEADIKGLRDAKPLMTEVKPLQKLRHQHHLLARLIAEGKSLVEASYVTGYDEVYICNIKNSDPAFKNLVAYYKDQTQEIYLNVHERLANLGIATVDELQDRLTNAADTFTHAQLMELAKLTLDRGGYGPTSTVTNNNTFLSTELIDRIKEQIARRSTGAIKQIDQRSAVGAKGVEVTLAESDFERVEGKGADV